MTLLLCKCVSLFSFSFYQRENIKQENDERGHFLHRRRFVTAVLPWRCWWVVCTAVKKRQTHLKSLLLSRSSVCTHFTIVVLQCAVIQASPEWRAEAAGHVLPQVVAVHGAHEHVHRLDDLWCILVLLDLSVYGENQKIHLLLMSAFELVWLN